MDLQIVTILNALKGPPGNILLALISHSRPLGTNELVTLTGWCESSVNAGLQKLKMMGWVEREARYKGWALVRAVRISVIPKIFAVTDLARSPGEDSFGNREILSSQDAGEPEGVQDLDGSREILSSQYASELEGVQDLDGNRESLSSLVSEQSHPTHMLTGNREIYSSNRTPDTARTVDQQASRESQGSPPSKARASPARRYPTRKKYRSNRKNLGSQSPKESLEEDLTLKTLDLSSSTDSDSALPPENGPPGRLDQQLSSADVGKILDTTEQLFGERVMGNPARNPDPVRLLAAIAEAYHNRQNLRKPARVVFKNLRNETNIGQKYFADPCSYLPDSFLQAAGLPRSRIVDQSPAGSKSDHSRYLEGLPDYETNDKDESLDPPSLPDPHPSLTHQVGENTKRTAVDAWAMVKSILEAQLETGVYQRYLARAFLTRYDFSSNTFTVAVEDPFTRTWLQERSVRLVERLLVGICNRPAAVQYVTVDQRSGDDPDTGGSLPLFLTQNR